MISTYARDRGNARYRLANSQEQNGEQKQQAIPPAASTIVEQQTGYGFFSKPLIFFGEPF